MSSSSFGDRLRHLRETAGMTQEELAEAAKQSVRNISGLEVGERANPRMKTVQQLANVLAKASNREPDQVRRQLLGTTEEIAPAEDARGEGMDQDPPRLPGVLADAADTLAHYVARSWRREEEKRRVQFPYVLPVRWQQASKGFDHEDNLQAARPGMAAEPLELSGAVAGIVEVYSRIPSRRLVLLGRAGSGKTVLASRFVLDFLDKRAAGRPVPVVFNMGSWDPTATALRDWMVGQLLRDHPSLAAPAPGGLTLAAALVADGGILPVLDGFDEIAPRLHVPALEELNNAARLPFVLTSRTTAFIDAVGPRVLVGAAGVELVDLTFDDVADYLHRTAPPTTAPAQGGRAATVWDPVFDQLRRQPDHPACALLIKVLTTPLMVMLARTMYSDTADPKLTPKELLEDTTRFPTEDAIESHLLARFVPVVYRRDPQPETAPGPAPRRRSWDDKLAEDYLGYLARHLSRPGQKDRQNLAWWQLADSLPPRSRILAVALASAVIVVLADWLAAVPFDISSPNGTSVILLGNLLDALVTGPPVGLAVGVAYTLFIVSGRLGLEPSRMQLRLSGRRQTPERPGFRRIAGGVSSGVLGGAVFGLMFGATDTIALALQNGYPLSGGLELTPFNMIFYGLVFGLTAGLAFGLIAWLEIPLDTDFAATPARLLAANRAIVLRQVLLLIPALVLAIFLAGGFITYLLQEPLNHFDTRLHVGWPAIFGLFEGIVGGLTITLVYALAATAWGQWILLVRIWLPLTGHLPWATLTFLEDAYDRGVLLHAGTVYQFRHARLQEHLSARHLSSQSGSR
ncbi:helix-turn-helix domain-containing protein [Catenulispora sp. MAP5-51]|uniref:NACHT domain-containing protein n=1 Tax=Catenulispora sp. MAP5-51 TaxID=3156298 RepID=UPI003512C93F